MSKLSLMCTKIYLISCEYYIKYKKDIAINRKKMYDKNI